MARRGPHADLGPFVCTDASQTGGPQLFGASKTVSFLLLKKQSNIFNRVFGIECLKNPKNSIISFVLYFLL